MRHDALAPVRRCLRERRRQPDQRGHGARGVGLDHAGRDVALERVPAALRRLQRELAEVDRLRAQAQRAALAVGDRRERRDQLLELLRGLDDLLQVHGVVAGDAAHALDRAREAEGRRQRRAEVVTGVDDEVRRSLGSPRTAGPG